MGLCARGFPWRFLTRLGARVLAKGSASWEKSSAAAAVGSSFVSLCLGYSMSPCTSQVGLGLLRGQLASEECRGASGGLSVEQTSSQVLQLL